MARQKRHTAADVHAAKMAELLNNYNWTLDQYVNSREVWGAMPERSPQKFQVQQLRRMGKRGPRCVWSVSDWCSGW